MVRLVREEAQAVLLGLVALYLRMADAETWQTLYASVHANMNAPNKVSRPVRDELDRLFNEGSAGSFNLKDLLDDVAKKVEIERHRQKGRVEGDLIDKIADVLQHPHTRNALSGPMLDALRKAILIPEEQAGLLDRLNKKEMSCATCGHPFVHGEMGTIQAQPRGGSVILCRRCLIPTQTACSGCAEGHVQITKPLLTLLQKAHDCGHAQQKKVDEQILQELQVAFDGPTVRPQPRWRIERATPLDEEIPHDA